MKFESFIPSVRLRGGFSPEKYADFLDEGVWFLVVVGERGGRVCTHIWGRWGPLSPELYKILGAEVTIDFASMPC